MIRNSKIHDEIKEIVNGLGYELLDEYIPEKGSRRVIIKDKIGYRYDVEIQTLKRGNIPNFVDVHNPYSLENISLWLSLNRPEFELCKDNVYKGAFHKLKLYHNIIRCGEYFEINWNNIYQNRGCSICSGQKVGKKTSLAYKRPDLAKEWHPNNIKVPEEVVCGSNDKAYWICSVCGYGKNKEWNVMVKSRALDNTGCPKCSFSKGEDKIEKFLSENNIIYIAQKKFENCKDERSLPFDFGIPYENNVWKCIEFYGEQHFFPVDFSGHNMKRAEQNFKELKKRDKIKQKYCKNNNIQLVIIPYWDFENIEEILKEVLC